MKIFGFIKRHYLTATILTCCVGYYSYNLCVASEYYQAKVAQDRQELQTVLDVRDMYVDLGRKVAEVRSIKEMQTPALSASELRVSMNVNINELK